MAATVFAISFLYLASHVGHFGLTSELTDAKILSHGIHALIVCLGFVTLAIEKRAK